MESTVLDVTGSIPIILRPGGVTKEQLEKVIGEVKLDAALHDLNAIPRAPGMKYTHYSPEADVVILKGSVPEMITKILAILENSKGKLIGIMASQEMIAALPRDLPDNIITRVLGSENDLETITANLFETLRWFDEKGVEVIYGESFTIIISVLL